ncbi:N-acetylmuramic acid 6-phosphate etherase [Nocardioides mangrovicus]|uniref:N-acetylmuramic acid 6-phosphate etherase n=1 Tax=Nocardioides mangrovicus TaxID=2478913 RepID=A0A3L8P1K4_9ACTN|nr:N-acetylmuramic acid 6-phosphate etherase [Nocardioides mangrovicus]
MTGLRESLGSLATEAVDPAFEALDAVDTLEAARMMNQADAGVAAAVERVLPQVARAVDEVTSRMRRGGRLVYAGAGTAGRLGVLDASECPPTFDTDPACVVGLIAGGERALTTAVEGAEDSRVEGFRVVDELAVDELDTVVGISASGRTPYAIGAVERAAVRGCFTVGLACNAGSDLGRAAELAIEVVVGPEVIAGSTRLKAGTAQKLVLNMISTLTMVRLGKTYQNLMVDLRATNEKLAARSWRIVREATGAADADVDRALAEADGEVKTAIAVLLGGVGAGEARRRLDAHGGVLRDALTDLGTQGEHHAHH